MSTPRVFGWAPSSPEGDFVDLPSQASRQFTFKVERLAPSSLPSAPSEGLLTTTTVERQIPRPPNSFIIFRTEFSQRHKNARGSRARRDVKEIGVTVSRKAADAWRKLSPEEKQPYQRRAELAKEQHARDYPNYQYRPRRGDRVLRRTPPAPKERRASPALTFSTVRDTSDLLGLSPPAEEPPSSPESERPPPAVDPAVKSDRRRSSSVPVTWGELLYTSTLWPEDLGRDRWERADKWDRPAQAKRRSRSVSGQWIPPPQTFQVEQPVSFDPRSPQNAFFSPSVYPTPFRVQSPRAHLDTLNPAALFAPTQHMSPMTAIVSSLAGWDGTVPANPVAPQFAPMAPQPLRFNQPAWLASPETMPDPGPSPEFGSDGAGPLTPLPTDQWALDPDAQSVFGASTWDGAVHGRGASDPEDYVRTAALQEYELGLRERVHCMGEPIDNNDFTYFGALELDFDRASDQQF
ncbi:hypothetical protein B0H19DRAFT_1061322 [Mycena capillaripes]|nr:hypothetical protein B0H19DRAFT_1061322 [Mycena capillaripes]